MIFLKYIPNIITFIRFNMAFPLAYLLWNDQIVPALILLVAAALSDLLDGYLAREFNWRSRLGSWLDPAADKMLITTILITLTLKGAVPVWFCFVTMVRDIGLVVGTLVLMAKGMKIGIRPLLTGKLATVAQNVALLLATISPLWRAIEPSLSFWFYLSAVLTAISAVAYGKTLRNILVSRVSP